jgi:Tfp pilus assembly protein PilO
MNSLNSKTKVILVIIVFLIFAVAMYMFGFGILGNRNQVAADSISQRRIELEVLSREQKSFEQGKKDLAQLEQSLYPPGELFSRDTKVVNEIQQLEATAQRYSVELDIAVAGTSKTAVKVPDTTGELFAIPYTITLSGPFSNILLFMQASERLPFITHAKDVSVSVNAENAARTVISSEFYIKK